MRRFNNNRGFTLIEMLLVCAILGLVMVAVYSLYLNTQRTAYTSEEVVDAQQNLRIAMDTMVSDIRMAGFLTSSSVDAVSNGPATLSSVDKLILQAPVSSGVYSRAVTGLVIDDGDTRTIEVDALMGAGFDEVATVTVLIMNPVTLDRRGTLTVPVGGVAGAEEQILTLVNATGATVSISERDIILKRATADDTYPVRISYSLETDPDSDDARLLLLKRSVQGAGVATVETVAAGIVSVQLTYLDDNGNDSSGDLGETSAISLLITSGTEDNEVGRNKSRQLQTVVKIRNAMGA